MSVDILTPLLLAHPHSMALLGVLVALGQFGGLIRQLSILFGKGGSNGR